MRLDCLSQNNACSSMNQPPWDFCSLDWYAIFPTNLELASFGSTPDRSVQHAHARCPVHHVAPPHPTQCVQHAHPLLLLWAHWPGPFFGGFSVFLKKSIFVYCFIKNCSGHQNKFQISKMFMILQNVLKFKNVLEFQKYWWIQKKMLRMQKMLMNSKKKFMDSK